MDTKVENGGYVLSANGLPQVVEGRAELAHYARMRLVLRRGQFPYDRDLGSGLWQWSPQEPRALDRALALANEALLDLPGVRAVSAKMTEDSKLGFVIQTPLGEEEITLGEFGWDL